MNKAIFYKKLNDENKFWNKSSKILVVGQVQSGKTKFMIERAVEAFKEYNFDVIVFLGGNNKNLLNQTRGRIDKYFSISDFSIIDIEENIYSRIHTRKTIVSSLKTKKSLEKLYNLLDNSDNKKIIVFDDESDYGGIDIGNDFSSTIFGLLRKISERIFKMGGIWVSVTATPFADLLSNNHIDFDLIHLLEANNDYTGINFFENEKNNIYEEKDVTKDIRRLNKIEFEWQKMLISHIERCCESNVASTQFLINCDLDNIYHNKLKLFFENIFQNFRHVNYNGLFNKKYDIRKIKSILFELKENIYTLNEDNNNFDKTKHSIIIGGTLISRGYTFENLLTMILFNEPQDKSAADTLLQRARWFGYRKEIYKYMKVYMSRKLIDSFSECCELVNVLEKAIKENPNNQNEVAKKIKELEFKNIILTRKAKNE